MLDSVPNPALLRAALDGLQSPQKHLGAKWLYDQRGSELFERITTLPEYYPTRTEAGILRDHADRLVSVVPSGGALVELGSGASVKTRTLLDAGRHLAAYVPVDISEDFLHATARTLRARYPALAVHPVVGDFTGPVTLPAAVADMAKVGFFPGSTIGNVDPDVAIALLRAARDWPGSEGFILGADLVKDEAELIAAYDDTQGVTAEFILNVLNRLNAEANADFNLAAWSYAATWNAALAQIEMRVISETAQSVRIDGVAITFAEQEPIHISTSRKYTAQSLAKLAQAAGWQIDDLLMDEDDKFAVAVLR